MTFDEVGAPARLSGGLSPATNIPVVHTLLMAIQSTFDLEPEEPRRRYEKNGRVTTQMPIGKSYGRSLHNKNCDKDVRLS